jgi:hypothetical protein
MQYFDIRNGDTASGQWLAKDLKRTLWDPHEGTCWSKHQKRWLRISRLGVRIPPGTFSSASFWFAWPCEENWGPIFAKKGISVAKSERFAKESKGDRKKSKYRLLAQEKARTSRYVRNAGIKKIYRRGKVYYYVKHGKWISLLTRDQSEARRQLERLREQEIGLKFLKKSGLLQLLKNQA